MSTISASTTSTTGFKVTSDTTGTLVFQTGASPTTAMSISSSQIISFTNPPTATGGGSVSTNTAFGTSALAANTTGSSNVGIGYQALLATTTAQGLTAVGASALSGSNTGSYNNAFGTSVLAANTSGTENNGFGFWALLSNTTGIDNSAFGEETLRANTTGSYNTAYGAYALRFNTTGNNNTAVGYQALYSCTTTGANTAIGRIAGYSATTGDYNTFVGDRSGYSVTTSANNSFFGHYSGYSTTGSSNTFIGVNAGWTVTSGSKNTILGFYNGNQGGLDIRTASNYIVLSDGDGNPRGYFVGGLAYSDFHINSGAGAQYSVLSFTIGGSGYVAQMYWDANTNRFQTYTNANGPYISQGSGSWTSSSDERLKNITGEIENGLSKVCALRAAKYHWKSDENAVPRVGLIAQDVLAVLPEAVEIPPEGSLDKEGNPAMMGVQYTEVIPLLVAAIKELKAEIDTLKGQA